MPSKHNLPKLTQSEIENLNGPKAITEIELIAKSLTAQLSQGLVFGPCSISSSTCVCVSHKKVLRDEWMSRHSCLNIISSAQCFLATVCKTAPTPSASHLTLPVWLTVLHNFPFRQYVCCLHLSIKM